MRISAAVLFSLLALGCGDDDVPADTGAADARRDSGSDVGLDAAVRDTSTDTSSSIDVGAESDAATDGGSDTGVDAAERDSGPSRGVNCDVRDIRCRTPAPACEFGQVPEVVGTCYGECVDIGECACTESAECGDELLYVCRRDGRCTPPL